MNISTSVYISLSLEFVDLLKFNVYIYFRMDGVCLFWEPKFKVAFFLLDVKSLWHGHGDGGPPGSASSGFTCHFFRFLGQIFLFLTFFEKYLRFILVCLNPFWPEVGAVAYDTEVTRLGANRPWHRASRPWWHGDPCCVNWSKRP